MDILKYNPIFGYPKIIKDIHQYFWISSNELWIFINELWISINELWMS